MTDENLTPNTHASHASQDTLPASDSIFKLIVENTVDLIVRGDASRNRTYVSPSSREMLGYQPKEMLGKHAYELVHPDDLPRTQEVFSKIGPLHPKQELTFRMRRRDGSYIWVGATYRHLPADDGVLAVLRDITAQKVAEQRLEEANAKLAEANAFMQGLAEVDGLTGLANRRHFDLTLDKEFRRARRHQRPLGLVLFDVDYFKMFNDRYGHLGGDDCLRQVSRCLSESTRRPDDLTARYGGEEIVMLLPATDRYGSLQVAEQARTRLATLGIQHDGSTFGVVTVSAGVAAMHPWLPMSDPGALIKAADVALYEAKGSGRNRVCCCAENMAQVSIEGCPS